MKILCLFLENLKEYDHDNFIQTNKKLSYFRGDTQGGREMRKNKENN